MKGLAIKDVAERTGLAAGTIRMWEQRYGVPVPRRAPSGYRMYSDEDVDLLRRAVAFRERGLSVPAALERARGFGSPTDRPLAIEQPAPALTALTNRLVAYLDAA